MANDSCHRDKWHNHKSLNSFFYRELLQDANEHSSAHVQVRCINPAIYAEPLKISESYGPTECPEDRDDSSANLLVRLSNVSINDEQLEPSNEQINGFERLKPSKTSIGVTRRCTYVHPSEAQRISHKSIYVPSEIPLGRKTSHTEWMQKKKLKIRDSQKLIENIELIKKREDNQSAREKEEREKKARENFLIWMEKKRQEDIRKQKIVKEQAEFERQSKDFEAKIAIAKEIFFQRWCHKKDKLQNVEKEKIESKLKDRELKQKKRRIESSEAFSAWQKKSKNRPKPATQGLLPHQRATPMYINPIPWAIDENPEVSQESLIHQSAPSK